MSKWTPDEERRLRELYATHTRREIAAVLGRTETSVRQRCYKLGLNTKGAPDWSQGELDALFKFYVDHVDQPFPRGGLRGLAKSLGRPHTNVCRKARECGLTKLGRPKCVGAAEEMSERARQWLATHEHPRGMAGKVHSEETKRSLSDALRARWLDPSAPWHREEFKQRQSDVMIARLKRGEMLRGKEMYSRCASGRRADLGDVYFRSRWEANYARFLNSEKAHGRVVSWEYEAHTFFFEKIKRGTRSYTPDFKITMPNGAVEWHEVKGWMDQKSRTRLDRMSRYYPDETVVVVGKAWFSWANRNLARVIPNWEMAPRKPYAPGAHRKSRRAA